LLSRAQPVLAGVHREMPIRLVFVGPDPRAIHTHARNQAGDVEGRVV